MRLQFALVVCLVLVLFIGGALRQADTVNANMEASDQSAYIDYAKNLHMSHFRYIGDRNRMPVYPSLMALFYRDGMTDSEFFEVGKRVGIVTALVVLITCTFILIRYVRFFEACTAVLIAAFTVFAYKAPYFQADVLFYGIAFVLFILMVELIVRPTLVRAIGVGFVGGVAHLTKASVMPGLILCWVCLLLRVVWAAKEVATHQANVTSSKEDQGWRRRFEPVVYAGLSGLAFLAVVFPYIHTSKQQFGRYFYNVNSTFYMWCDSWAEVTAGPRTHGDRFGWPDLPPDKTPSMSRYLREHSPRQLVSRFVEGAVFSVER